MILTCDVEPEVYEFLERRATAQGKSMNDVIIDILKGDDRKVEEEEEENWLEGNGDD